MTTELFGRDEELAAIGEHLGTAAQGFTAVVIDGEAGIGKTSLWREALEAARGRSLRVLACAPDRQEAQLGFAGLADLLAGAFDEVAADLPDPQRRALEVALQRRDPGDIPSEPAAGMAGFLGVLRALAADAPLVVAVDDVQWLDEPTAGLLAFAARRLDSEPVAFLIARRTASDEPAPLGLDRALPPDRLLTVRLGGLSIGAVHHLLHTRLNLSLPRPALRRVEEAAAGNPFYALEIGRGLQRAGGRPDPGSVLPVPETLRELVRDRLEGLPQTAHEALAAAAAMAGPTVDHVAAATGGDGWEALRPAVEADVIVLDGERVRFTHPLLAAAVYDALDLGRQRELHRRLASVVADPEARAAHLAEATAEPDAGIAAELDAGARRARARGATGTAAELLGHARRLTPPSDVDEWARRTVEAAGVLRMAGDAEGGNEIAAAVLDANCDPLLRARARLYLIEEQNRPPEFAALALEEAGDDLVLRTNIQARMSVSSTIFGSNRDGVRQARDALESAKRSGDPAAMSVALGVLGTAEAIAGDSRGPARLDEAAELDLSVRPPWLYSSGRVWRGIAAMWRDELDSARDWLHEMLREATDLGDDDATLGMHLHLAELEVRAGRLEPAVRHAARGLDGSRQSGQPQSVGATLFTVALVDAHRGRLAEARAAAEQGMAIGVAEGDALFPPQHRTVLGFAAVSAGDYAAALEHIRELPETLEAIGVGEPGIYIFEGDELEALVHEGELERAEARIAAIEARGRELDRPRELVYAARGRALLLAARGDVDGALGSAHEALGHHERLPVPFERARTLLALGSLERRVKHRKAARDALEEAAAAFDGIGSPLWSERARGELGRIGGRAPSRGELTPTERRVAELVAAGRSNKEAAAELFVTVGTVEANLTRIYSKLGLRSRTELARHFADTP